MYVNIKRKSPLTTGFCLKRKTGITFANLQSCSDDENETETKLDLGAIKLALDVAAPKAKPQPAKTKCAAQVIYYINNFKTHYSCNVT